MRSIRDPRHPSPRASAGLPTRLSHHFSLAGLTRSETARRHGIDNRPPPEIVPNLRLLACGLDEVRQLLGHRLRVSSGYRCPALNAAVGGARTSQHCEGLAADFECPAFGTPLEIVAALRRSSIAFDQCILEFGRWVHVSFSRAPRRRVLTIYDDGMGYREGLFDTDGRMVD
ncbi:MAG: D-Ala-D-Ala carboxypeptidase family metallohydrolase [Burkholderiales bacterium]|nr:D-Ala-D-Ala carboxypeptidase family metallohydrolase [Burkholderiales bacterium]